MLTKMRYTKQTAGIFRSKTRWVRGMQWLHRKTFYCCCYNYRIKGWNAVLQFWRSTGIKILMFDNDGW